MATNTDPHSHHSTLRERTVEHLFVGEVLRTLWRKGIYNVEVLRSEFDAHGYDVVLTNGRVTRHLQLKTGRDAVPQHVPLALALGEKPSGCALWIQVSPDLELGPYFFFGGKPGKRLPSIVAYDRPLRATHNKKGVRPVRNNHRLVPRTQFDRLDSLDEVVAALFGRMPRESIADAVRRMVRAGKSNAEIWSDIQPSFGLSADKKWYPAWYRAEMKRKGIR
jgi:hypothetical protein